MFDDRDTWDPAAREAALLARLPALVAAAQQAPGWARHLAADPAAITSRAALATLPILRKSDLPALQAADPPLGGFRTGWPRGGRVFASPGPIFEREGAGADPWRGARAFHAAGFRAGDLVVNTLSYHLTPGGFILETGARALGCAVLPAGPGNTAQLVEIASRLQPIGYAGTPDFLKILLDAGAISFKKALVSGAAFPPSLQRELSARGVEAYQAYATADLGIIAYETPARDGLLVNEDILLEIVRPGTGDPVAEGEVGEVVVTSFSEEEPLIRFALGDLSALMPGLSPCGRTAPRIRGWLGRADQAAKVRGMFVRPEQIAAIARQTGLTKLRLVITRADEQDRATVRAEGPAEAAEGLAAAFQDLTKLKAVVEMVAQGALPNDGKVIADERPH